MEERDKELLLTDLCARLPYNVWVRYKTKYDDVERATILNGNYVREIMEGTSYWIDFKPYLRPMSSMTEEEQKEYHKTFRVESYGNGYVYVESAKSFDWLNKNMFDYRGLIEKGRAIKVTEENNPYKDKD